LSEESQLQTPGHLWSGSRPTRPPGRARMAAAFGRYRSHAHTGGHGQRDRPPSGRARPYCCSV